MLQALAVKQWPGRLMQAIIEGEQETNAQAKSLNMDQGRGSPADL